MTHSLTTHPRPAHSRTTRSRATKAVTGLLATAALLAVGAAPAQATAPRLAPESFSGNWLYFTVTRGDAPNSDKRGVLLMCDPPRRDGRAAEACAQLDTVKGDLTRLQAADGLCTMIYAPVTVEARGEWNGEAVEYTQTYANECVMNARTGRVFALDD